MNKCIFNKPLSSCLLKCDPKLSGNGLQTDGLAIKKARGLNVLNWH